MSRKRRTFTADFKMEAVALAQHEGFAQAALSLGINEGNLRNWVKAVVDRGAQAFAHLTERTDADAELKRLRAESHQPRMERDIKKSGSVLRPGKRMRYRFIS